MSHSDNIPEEFSLTAYDDMLDILTSPPGGASNTGFVGTMVDDNVQVNQSSTARCDPGASPIPMEAISGVGLTSTARSDLTKLMSTARSDHQQLNADILQLNEGPLDLDPAAFSAGGPASSSAGGQPNSMGVALDASSARNSANSMAVGPVSLEPALAVQVPNSPGTSLPETGGPSSSSDGTAIVVRNSMSGNTLPNAGTQVSAVEVVQKTTTLTIGPVKSKGTKIGTMPY